MKQIDFLQEIEDITGEKVSTCFQCCKCTTGCPVVTRMDIYPHNMIRHIILGNRDKVLTSKAIWTCIQCITCSVRCPNNIDIARILNTLRKIAIQEGKALEKDTWQFDTMFMESVKKHGRLYEVGTILRYKITTRDFVKDFKMGLGLLFKGRIGIMPHTIKNRRALKVLFRNTYEARDESE